MTLRQFVRLIRMEHWVKNLFLFIPAFFAARLSEWSLLQHAAGGFFAFSLVASSVYVLNDLFDLSADRGPVMVVHPDNVWYGKVNEEAIDEILDAMQEGETCPKYELT